MSSFTLSDLAALGTPAIIEQIDFETILATRKAEFAALMAAVGLSYDVAALETDPATVLLEEASYEEVILRARLNDVALQRYLYWAVDTALDHLAAFYDVTRLAGELDPRLKLRVILAIQGRSTGGTEARYRFIALSSSLDVADAKVYVLPLSPIVNVAVFADTVDGIASGPLLAIVSAALNASDVKMVNDTLNVVSAVINAVSVVADVMLLPDTDASILTTLQTAIPTNWIAASGLGRDLLPDWIKSQIFAAGGVYSVNLTSPSAPVAASPYQAVRISSVTLNFAGRAY